MRTVLRWGQSAYETDADMARERRNAEALGLAWTERADPKSPPAQRADVLVVTSKAWVTPEVLDTVQPELVVTTTSGFEHLDLQACADRGIVAARCPLARRDAVVEHTLEALIRLLRRLPDQERPAREGRWARGDLPSLAPRGIRGSTVVVVGVGVIGSRVAALLEGLGAEVLGVDPSGPDVGIPLLDLDQALARADAVTLHASSSETSRGLFGRRRLRSLPRGCVVVNTARGDLMDPLAAAGLVENHHLGGLACDVFPEEPWPHLEAHASDHILLTPHASGYTRDLGARVAADVEAALAAYVEGGEVPWRLV